MAEYIINCPKCKSSFDVSKQMEIWKEELFIDINKLIQNKLKGGKTNGTTRTS